MQRRPNQFIPLVIVAILGLAAVGAAVVWATTARTRLSFTPARTEQTSWRPVGSLPLSDAEAAARVFARPEQHPENAEANDFVPSDAELAAWVPAVRDLASSSSEVHMIMDNCWRTNAVDNAASMLGLLASS